MGSSAGNSEAGRRDCEINDSGLKFVVVKVYYFNEDRVTSAFISVGTKFM